MGIRGAVSLTPRCSPREVPIRMARKLKVNRTPIGFHDAHVAATSQRKALMAWDADIDLFARGVADTATDEALTGQPLQRPERIVRRARCTAGNALRKWRE